MVLMQHVRFGDSWMQIRKPFCIHRLDNISSHISDGFYPPCLCGLEVDSLQLVSLSRSMSVVSSVVGPLQVQPWCALTCWRQANSAGGIYTGYREHVRESLCHSNS